MICGNAQPVIQYHRKWGDNVDEDLLIYRLCNDLDDLGMPVNEVDMSVRPYTSSYYGRYFPVYDETWKTPKIYLYPYRDRNDNMYSYPTCLEVAIHEMVHHIQHSNPKWKRLAGVAHDPEFWKLYNMYMFRAKLIGVIPNEYNNKTA